MERTSSWLISFFVIMFWIFRIIVSIFAQTGSDWAGFVVFDFNTEIILHFITILSFVLVVKRKIMGAILYLITYGYYFGGYIWLSLLPIISNGNEMTVEGTQNLIVAILAIILSVFVFIDVLIDKIKRKKYSDSNTDWFFNNKNTDRKIDEKADKNQYKIY